MEFTISTFDTIGIMREIFSIYSLKYLLYEYIVMFKKDVINIYKILIERNESPIRLSRNVNTRK